VRRQHLLNGVHVAEASQANQSAVAAGAEIVLPMTLPPERRFRELAERWRKDTAFLSSTNDLATHPAYQQVIGMGKEALPFIFAQLRERPEHWFWALRSITGVDPVAPADRGNVRQTTAAWLRWASDHGF
jgi:hypothetical protein